MVDQQELWLVLLLPLCLCSEETLLVKTIGSEPDVTPLCTNETLSMITLIVCNITTKGSGEECRLLYGHGHDFVHECDSRFTLMTENQTVFLHLTSLTPVDSGNYTCECINHGEAHVLRLHLIVEAASYEEHFNSIFFRVLPFVAGGATAFIIVTGVVLGCILRKIHSRDDTRSGAHVLSVCEPPHSLDQDDQDDQDDPDDPEDQDDQDDPDDPEDQDDQDDQDNPDDPDDQDDQDNPYTSLQQPASDLYQTISSVQHQHYAKRNSASNNIVAAYLGNQETDSRETDPSCKIYENI